MNDEFERSRFRQRHKKRKTNVILNSLIAFVLLLIIVVSYNIFFSGNEPATSLENGETESSQEEKSAGNEKKTDEKEDKSSSSGNDDKSEARDSEKEKEDSSTEDESNAEQDDETVTEESDDQNVIESVVNPNWKPVGTDQAGEHIAVYSGVDWDEMVKAIEYATDLSQEEFTIHFLGNNGPNKSVGTIYTKDKEKIYRVYIEWVDEQGWKPTKVEQLSALE